MICDINPFPLRLEDGVKKELAESAKKNMRSLNSEIAYRLAEMLRRERQQAEQKAA